MESFININTDFNKKLPLNTISKILPFALNHINESLFITLTRNISESTLLSFFQSCDEIMPIENILYIDMIFHNRIIIPAQILEKIQNASDKIIDIFSRPFFLEKVKNSIIPYLKQGTKYFPVFMKNKLVQYLQYENCLDDVDQIEKLFDKNKSISTKIVYENLEKKSGFNSLPC